MSQQQTTIPIGATIITLLCFFPLETSSFIPSSSFGCRRCSGNYLQQQQQQQQRQRSTLFSSVGDDDIPRPPNEGDDGNDWDDFLDPNKKESENLQRARAYMSEQSLPLSFDDIEEEDGVDGTDSVKEENKDTNSDDDDDALSFSALAAAASQGSQQSAAAAAGLLGSQNMEALAKNPYMNVVSKLSPSDLISRFTSTAHPRVQDAVRSTILGLIGSLPKSAFETTTITTGERLASLMFQLQMTGYMFKNAEYRLSLSQSLGMSSSGASPTFGQSSEFLLAGTDEEDEEDPLQGKVKGKIKITYGDGKSKKDDNNDKISASTSSDDSDTPDDNDDSKSSDSPSSLEMEVDAAAYMSELRSEVDKLRLELTEKRQSKEDAIRKDLLLYIRTLPKQELTQLTNTISEDVLVAMKGLVNVVMAGIGEGQIGPETVTEQSGEAMAQLCMWQLVVGYNMRELEVREEMKNNLFNSWDTEDDDTEGGVDFEAGTME
mmetsp:Transcript_29439/g.45172  ORF Transcript_29439/g.45172 Transcript_29439/m.45172 type:complete len:490 (+) Transcript_29439:189-1658(+)|eukprot:CAMPEP_0195281656 /NCGR_PEP_ID=MMETSP0707-20130614/874_1 /TAXON_ID=33640 /ORGANISM="Asterionellopsis glacialis, Strain CCMP134" /LENGTH=489 /DNA_ID=CAMNT_0040340561 /DNA_START=146 /DNA_END=1615 /DNA_ORIENTATION=-